MSELYVRESNHRGYILDGEFFHPINENYIIQKALIEAGEKVIPRDFNKNSNSTFDAKLVFVEYSFDPIGRIKRGKFYRMAESSPERWLTKVNHELFQQHNGGPLNAKVYEYTSYSVTADINDVRDAAIYFVNPRIKSKWKFLAVEPLVGYEEICVLQEVFGLGVTPYLNKSAIPADYVKEIENQYSSLLAELHASPESIVDHCRDVATSLLSGNLNLSKDKRGDLGDLIKNTPDNLKIVKSCAEVINRFHVRRKPNEQDKLNLPALTKADAEYAVQSIFQIIKELKWSI